MLKNWLCQPCPAKFLSEVGLEGVYFVRKCFAGYDANTMPTHNESEALVQKLRLDIQKLLKEGYAKASLARKLEVSRSTFLRLLEDEAYIPTDTIIARARINVEWLKKSHGHELLECLILLYFQRPNILPYFEAVVQKAEQHTGFFVGYHGVVLGGPVGFFLVHTPGVAPLTEILGTKPFPNANFGRTETMVITGGPRLSGNHKEAALFYNRHPQARIYLKLFQSFSASASEDLDQIQRMMLKRHRDTIYCLESGLVTGRYDYFVLVIAKDEQAYLDFMLGEQGIYSITSKRMTDSITLSVTPQGVRPLFEPECFNLSFTREHVDSVRKPKRRKSRTGV